MKHLFVAVALLAAVSAAQAKDTVKLTFAQIRDLIGYQAPDGKAVPGALALLDGSTRLDKDNAQVQIAYQFKGSVRFAISRDIAALSDAQKTIITSWQTYLKGAGITDESKETDAQRAQVASILTTPIDVDITKFSEDDLVPKDSDINPIPPSVLTRLLPIIK
jgi:hypothetical protein